MSLKINNLKKKFGEAEVLNDFSFKFENSGAYIILGESGAGKTTLLRIIAGLDIEYTGTVEDGGVENISFMFQEYRLFPALNALQNVLLARDGASVDEAENLLLRLGFKRDDLKKKPRQLSGGMKQRVAFSRAIMRHAPILLLDEPTKELDSDTAKNMLEIINEEAKKRLVIIVTHDDIAEKIENSTIIRL